MNLLKTWNRISNVMKSKTASSEIESNGKSYVMYGWWMWSVWSKIQFSDKNRFFDSFYLL